MSVVEVLPFVPTTWIAGNALCGSPSEASSARMRPRPNSSGQGESDASQATLPSAEGSVVGTAAKCGDAEASGRRDPGARVDRRARGETMSGTCGAIVTDLSQRTPGARPILELGSTPTGWEVGSREKVTPPEAAAIGSDRLPPDPPGRARKLAAERLEVAAEALELLALRLDELGRGVRDEAVVREHALGAGDLL